MPSENPSTVPLASPELSPFAPVQRELRLNLDDPLSSQAIMACQRWQDLTSERQIKCHQAVLDVINSLTDDSDQVNVLKSYLLNLGNITVLGSEQLERMAKQAIAKLAGLAPAEVFNVYLGLAWSRQPQSNVIEQLLSSHILSNGENVSAGNQMQQAALRFLSNCPPMSELSGRVQSCLAVLGEANLGKILAGGQLTVDGQKYDVSRRSGEVVRKALLLGASDRQLNQLLKQWTSKSLSAEQQAQRARAVAFIFGVAYGEDTNSLASNQHAREFWLAAKLLPYLGWREHFELLKNHPRAYFCSFFLGAIFLDEISGLKLLLLPIALVLYVTYQLLYANVMIMTFGTVLYASEFVFGKPTEETESNVVAMVVSTVLIFSFVLASLVAGFAPVVLIDVEAMLAVPIIFDLIASLIDAYLSLATLDVSQLAVGIDAEVKATKVPVGGGSGPAVVKAIPVVPVLPQLAGIIANPDDAIQKAKAVELRAMPAAVADDGEYDVCGLRHPTVTADWPAP